MLLEFEGLLARCARPTKGRWFEHAPGGDLPGLGLEGVRTLAARLYRGRQPMAGGVHLYIQAGDYNMLRDLGVDGLRLSTISQVSLSALFMRSIG